MKKSKRLVKGAWLLPFFFLLISNLPLQGEESPKDSLPLPENISKIVTVSCMPCHSSSGGMLSRSKLNFSEWVSYPADKQKDKAEEILKEVKKNKMPPKSARENNPAIIPTEEQIALIKEWVENL